MEAFSLEKLKLFAGHLFLHIEELKLF